MGDHAEGSTGKFRNLVASYAPAIRRLCAAYARNSHDREDLSQNIFLAIWKALPAFRGESSERTWVYSIAHNVALTWQAGEKRSLRERFRLEESPEAAHLPGNERRLLLYELVGRLAPIDRQVIILWLEGLTAAEIGDIAGMRPGAVAVRLTRIRQSLAEAFQVSEARNG